MLYDELKGPPIRWPKRSIPCHLFPLSLKIPCNYCFSPPLHLLLDIRSCLTGYSIPSFTTMNPKIPGIWNMTREYREAHNPQLSQTFPSLSATDSVSNLHNMRQTT